MIVIDYLYYRFYRLWLKSSVAEVAVLMVALLFTVFLFANVLTICGILEQYGLLTTLTKLETWIMFGCIFILLSLRLFYKKRYKMVIQKFEGIENNKWGGSLCLLVYIVLSFFFLLWEGLYRHGKL